GEPVNKISRAVKNDFLGTFESLERERAVQAVAFFSGKPDNFIAGADIEEFVALTTAAEAERLVADGQELLERVARFPKPVAVGIHGACLRSEEHTSELQSRFDLVCRLLLEKKNTSCECA